MNSSNGPSLVAPMDGLLTTPPSRLPYQRNVLLRSYILERPQGNVIVKNSPGVSDSVASILALGTPVRLLVNHCHEAMYGQPELDVPVWIYREDQSGVSASLDVAGVFTNRQMIDDDLEVIPTPGHTAGTTSYLWDNGTHRYLFTGDFIWIEDGQWKAVVLDPGLRSDYLDSLALVRSLDFDVLVPWGATEGSAPCDQVAGPADMHGRIDAVIDRVRAGGNR